MQLPFPSPQWAEAFKDAVNENPVYRQAAANWTEGAIAFVCMPAPELGLEHAQAMVLELVQGECRAVEYTTDSETLAETPFVIEATYDRWRSIIQGKIDPIHAMMQGQLKLTRGHLPTLIRDVESAKQLVLSASHVETEFLT